MEALAAVEPYLPELKRYCRVLTSHEWDAEDLLQEVLAKVYKALLREPDRPLAKAYLRQIARTTWLDHCRKRQREAGREEFCEDRHLPAAGPDALAVREALEQLAGRLNPRQLVLILLLDVFGLSAAETAERLQATTGAVKEGLKRARLRLRALAAQDKQMEQENRHPEAASPSSAGSPQVLFEQFLAGFRAGDPQMICRSYLALAAKGVRIEKAQRTTGVYSFTLRDPNGHLIGFFEDIGRPPVSF
ncbi:hypothetical protein J31TS4_18360 [Paenibacillus sp. J31TS4]|uniref:sigma-70 family RNA polymerase sigma factor n=1 Tax=Paenibacillus sp. J31TS4 TaxID=2807195 RepID=UPI001B06EB68|nr:sigma-70 family RNA polymerase sigma factor [Paenibacillus sp. J31TS4]GIP38556.1 hypothetical protein J31TS4_18360 [Paenibacillus sp. J31TS4]